MRPRRHVGQERHCSHAASGYPAHLRHQVPERPLRRCGRGDLHRPRLLPGRWRVWGYASTSVRTWAELRPSGRIEHCRKVPLPASPSRLTGSCKAAPRVKPGAAEIAGRAHAHVAVEPSALDTVDGSVTIQPHRPWISVATAPARLAHPRTRPSASLDLTRCSPRRSGRTPALPLPVAPDPLAPMHHAHLLPCACHTFPMGSGAYQRAPS